jgi:hypothetical protein
MPARARRRPRRTELTPRPRVASRRPVERRHLRPMAVNGTANPLCTADMRRQASERAAPEARKRYPGVPSADGALRRTAATTSNPNIATTASPRLPLPHTDRRVGCAPAASRYQYRTSARGRTTSPRSTRAASKLGEMVRRAARSEITDSEARPKRDPSPLGHRAAAQASPPEHT